MKKPTLLIVNDDGYSAPGIRELYDSIQNIGDVFVVAPATQKSGTSVAFTLFSSVKVEAIDSFTKDQAWKVGGTPADCVKVALSHLKIFMLMRTQRQKHQLSI